MRKLFKCVSLFVFTFMFVSIVNAKTVTIKSVPPTTEDQRHAIADFYNMSLEEGYIEIDAEDNKKGTHHTGGQNDVTTPIDIVYEYDDAIKKVVDSLIKDLGTEALKFNLNDIEYFNYIRQSSKYFRENPNAQEPPSVGGFSNEVRKKLNYANFDIRIGLGEDNPIKAFEGGHITFIYDGTFYGKGPMAYVGYKNVVYIPKDAEDVEKAIKERLSKNFNVKSVSKSMYMGDTPLTLENFIASIRAAGTTEWNNKHTDPNTIESKYETADAYIDAQLALKDEMGISYNDILTDENLVGQLYDIVLDDEFEFLSVLVIRDDEKAKDDRKIITTDVNTGVELTTEGVIPLDVLIQVARVTSGDEYDKIVKVLKNTNVDMFDLKLYSNTSSSFITKLDNGKFRIKLPIKEEFKGKELKVYYVGEDDKVEEYEVTISEDGNYAIFETDHFSIYTLAAGAASKNPKTGDRIILYVVVLVLSTAYLLYRKLRKN